MPCSRRSASWVVREDADESGRLIAAMPDEEPYEDALDHAVRIDDVRPQWTCDCGTHNEGRRLNCVYCGVGREDV